MLLVDCLHPIEHLLGNHNNSFDGELPTTHIEQVFEAWAQEVDDKYVVQPFLSKMIYLGNTNCQNDQNCSKKPVCGGSLTESAPQPDNIL